MALNVNDLAENSLDIFPFVVTMHGFVSFFILIRR